jgi:integrase
MGRTRTKGISLERDGSRIVNKVWEGERIFARLGQVSQDAAERWLADEIANRKAARSCRRGDRALFADGAARYLIECRDKRSAETIAWHIKLLLPYIGSLPIDMVHDGTLEDFREERLAGLCDGKVETKSGRALHPVTPTTVNRSLEVVRTVLMRAARAWRDASGRPLLEIAPPLITMLDENRRPPYPIDWDEQDRLMRELPGHLQNPVLFALNTGLRDENVVGLRWDWERDVPEAGRSVFIVPAASYKTGVDHVAVLNDVAWSIIEAQRGRNPEWVFPYTISRKGRWITNRLGTINNGGYQNARARGVAASARA